MCKMETLNLMYLQDPLFKEEGRYLDQFNKLKTNQEDLKTLTPKNSQLCTGINKDEPGTSIPLGQVSVQIDIYTHPGTGEHRITVKVVSADDIQWKNNGIFLQFIEVNLVGPHMSKRKRCFSTRSKPKNWSPIFNETFRFNLSNEALVSSYELHFCAKDYCFARDDRVIGVSVLQLKNVEQQGSCACVCLLGDCINLDQTGWTILRILSQRSGDDLAKDFVKLKSSIRWSEDNAPT